MPALKQQGEQQTTGAAATKKDFVVSLVLHALVIGGLFSSALLFHKHGDAWGDKADVAGAVQATMVNSIPLPPKVQPKQDSVLASESPSPAPPPPTPKSEPPPKPTDIPVVKPPEKKQPAKVAEKPAPEPPKRPQPQPPQPDRATSGETAGLRVAMTAVENRAGTSSTNVTDSAFGQRYAYYVRQLTQKVASQWYTQTLDSGAPGHRVFISFRIARDGTPSDITIAKPSGDATLDSSALRALQRIDTFAPLPDGYAGSYINVQYYFDPKGQ
ncbi:MAG: TonB family protein [Janthinobacterium lividum]